jgi:hypothetical protein
MTEAESAEREAKRDTFKLNQQPNKPFLGCFAGKRAL